MAVVTPPFLDADTSSQARPARAAPEHHVEKPTFVLLLLTIALLMVSNSFLYVQNRHLKSSSRSVPRSALPQVGLHVPPMDGVDADGAAVNVTYGADPRRTVVMVFSTQCSICTLNWPIWKSIAQAVNMDRFRIIYVNLSYGLPPGYMRDKAADNSIVLAQVDPKVIVKYNLQFTPETILISPDGRIESVWLGLLDRDEVLSIKRSLKIDSNESSHVPGS